MTGNTFSALIEKIKNHLWNLLSENGKTELDSSLQFIIHR